MTEQRRRRALRRLKYDLRAYRLARWIRIYGQWNAYVMAHKRHWLDGVDWGDKDIAGKWRLKESGRWPW